MSWELVVWALSSAVGLAMTTWSTRDAAANLASVKALNGPLTERAAHEGVLGQRLLFLVQLDMVLVVLLVILLPTEARTVAVRLLLAAIPVVLMVLSIRGVVYRRWIVAYHIDRPNYGRRADDQ